MSAPADLPAVQVPFPVRVPHQVVPAFVPLDGQPHVLLDSAWPASVVRRVERLEREPDAILVRDPEGLDDDGLCAALRAAWHLLPATGLDLLGLQVDTGACTAEQVGPSAHQPATDAVLARSGWELLVVAWWMGCSDDLVVLRRSGPGALRAELLAVAFPSGWSPRKRAGASLSELHAPVADNARLQRAAGPLSEALLTKGPYLQHVWGIDRSGRLDDDPESTEADTGPQDDWHLRVERQTTVPLTGLDRALFTIRPYLVRISDLTAAQRTTLGRALRSMSPQSLAYKGVPASLLDELA